MHPLDLQKSLNSMVIICDTREQDTEQAHARYESFGCAWKREKLEYGDYSAVFTLPNGDVFNLSDHCVIERKMSLDELCGCFTHDRDRFRREFERAREAKAKIILLVENSTWEMAYAGKYRSQMKPSALVASILAWLARYKCQFLMCKAETSGKLIRDILYREAKEILEKDESFSGL